MSILPIALKYSATLRMAFNALGVDAVSEIPSRTTRYLCWAMYARHMKLSFFRPLPPCNRTILWFIITVFKEGELSRRNGRVPLFYKVTYVQFVDFIQTLLICSDVKVCFDFKQLIDFGVSLSSVRIILTRHFHWLRVSLFAGGFIFLQSNTKCTSLLIESPFKISNCRVKTNVSFSKKSTAQMKLCKWRVIQCFLFDISSVRLIQLRTATPMTAPLWQHPSFHIEIVWYSANFERTNTINK